MIGLKHVLGAGVLLVASVAAHATDTTYTFDSITAVQQSVSFADLTGVLVNDTVPTSLAVPVGTALHDARCIGYFDTMLKSPGIYTLSVTIRETVFVPSPGMPGNTSLNLFSCLLQRKP